MSEMAKGIERVRRGAKPLHGAIVFALSIAAVALGVLLSRGNGVGFVLYFLAAVFVVPIMVSLAGKYGSRPKLVQSFLLLLTLVCSFGVAYFSSRRPPEEIFQTVFQMPIPQGVTELTGRVQYFDGTIYLLQFRSTDDALVTLLRSRNFEHRVPSDTIDGATSFRAIWYGIRLDGALADPALNDVAPFANPQAYEWMSPDGIRDFESWNVVRDPATSRTWVVHRRGS